MLRWACPFQIRLYKTIINIVKRYIQWQNFNYKLRGRISTTNSVTEFQLQIPWQHFNYKSRNIISTTNPVTAFQLHIPWQNFNYTFRDSISTTKSRDSISTIKSRCRISTKNPVTEFHLHIPWQNFIYTFRDRISTTNPVTEYQLQNPVTEFLLWIHKLINSVLDCKTLCCLSAVCWCANLFIISHSLSIL